MQISSYGMTASMTTSKMQLVRVDGNNDDGNNNRDKDGHNNGHTTEKKRCSMELIGENNDHRVNADKTL